MVERPPHMPMPNPRFTYSFARPFNRLEDPSHAESAAYTKQATILAANVPTWKPPTSAMDELAYRSPVPMHPPRNTTATTSSRIICLFKMFLSSAPSHFVSRALFPCIVSHASHYSIGMLMHVTYLLESCVRSLSNGFIERMGEYSPHPPVVSILRKECRICRQFLMSSSSQNRYCLGTKKPMCV